jgi:hypothetical protein
LVNNAIIFAKPSLTFNMKLMLQIGSLQKKNLNLGGMSFNEHEM